LQLLKEMLPSLERVAFLWNPDNASHPAQLAEPQAAAQVLGLALISIPARDSREFDRAFGTITVERINGFLMTADLHQLSIARILVGCDRQS